MRLKLEPSEGYSGCVFDEDDCLREVPLCGECSNGPSADRAIRLAQVLGFLQAFGVTEFLSSLEESKGQLTVTWTKPVGTWERACAEKAWAEQAEYSGEHILVGEKKLSGSFGTKYWEVSWER